uniref:DDB1-and CUL4-associated factor 7 n=1 Tax=Aceria tosichella TaxID=561515 RepID=A0A6G1S5K8_9ACAR
MTTTTNDEGTVNYCDNDNLATDMATSSFDQPGTSVLSPSGDFVSLGGTKLEGVDITSTTPRGPTKSIQSVDKKREVYRSETDWLISNIAWANDGTYKLALTSYIERYKNFVQIVNLNRDEYDEDIESICTFEHPYPATKILWSPRPYSKSSQLLATTADNLRLWRLDENGESTSPAIGASESNQRVKLKCLLNANQGPLTSFDWSDDANLIVTSSFDSTCTIWDVNSGKITNLFPSDSMNHQGESGKAAAHQEHHTYDVAWSHLATGKDGIVMCGDDSIRLFDLREPANPITLYKISSTQILPSDNKSSLVRVSCSRQDSELVATFADNSGQLLIIDMRKPGRPLCVLEHSNSVNSISWSPKSSKGICSGGDDNQAYIWQVAADPPDDQPNEPLLAYRANGKINAVSWAPSNIFIAIGYRNVLELLRV